MVTRLLASSLAIALTLPAHLVTLHAAPDDKVFVTNGLDAGPGSFRAAIDLANSNPLITRIQFKPDVGCVFLSNTIYYTGTQDLTIDGNRSYIEAENAGGDAFVANGGGDLEIRFLTIKNAPGEGIEVQVPPGATGTQRVRLFNVVVAGNLGHGVLINDQTDPSTPEPPLRADETGSAASLDVVLEKSLLYANGYSESDRDGLRVNEGGDGDLTITVKFSLAELNGADGIEVDERGNGDVILDMFESQLVSNGSLDPEDLDDGFDIDESGPGSIVGLVAHSDAIDNYEEGFDFNENDLGDLRVDMTRVRANGNGEEGIDLEEDDDFAGGGDLVTTMSFITANGNFAGDGGLKIREKGDGNLLVDANEIETNDNNDGGDDLSGTSIREDAAGSLQVLLDKVESRGNSAHGIDLDENGAGDLVAEVRRTTATGNALVGLRADQALAGSGTLTLNKVILTGNGVAPQAGSNVTTIVVPGT